jgi:hypothetical protein
VDVHRAGEVGHPRVVEPVAVGEPAVGRGHGDEFARPWVVEAVRRLGLAVEQDLFRADTGQSPRAAF